MKNIFIIDIDNVEVQFIEPCDKCVINTQSHPRQWFDKSNPYKNKKSGLVDFDKSASWLEFPLRQC